MKRIVMLIMSGILFGHVNATETDNSSLKEANDRLLSKMVTGLKEYNDICAELSADQCRNQYGFAAMESFFAVALCKFARQEQNERVVSDMKTLAHNMGIPQEQVDRFLAEFSNKARFDSFKNECEQCESDIEQELIKLGKKMWPQQGDLTQATQEAEKEAV